MSVNTSFSLEKYAPSNQDYENKSGGGSFQASSRINKRSVEETDRVNDPVKQTLSQDSDSISGDPSKVNTPGGEKPDNTGISKNNFELKVANIRLPTMKEATIEPKFFFFDPSIHIHMCSECRTASRKLRILEIDEENQGLVINLCTICRAHLNTQRRVKFFKHDLARVKRHLTTKNTE